MGFFHLSMILWSSSENREKKFQIQGGGYPPAPPPPCTAILVKLLYSRGPRYIMKAKCRLGNGNILKNRDLMIFHDLHLSLYDGAWTTNKICIFTLLSFLYCSVYILTILQTVQCTLCAEQHAHYPFWIC